jgi:hypothetical protein
MKHAGLWRVRRAGFAIPRPEAAEVFRLRGDRLQRRGFSGRVAFDDGERLFSVGLRGPGSMDWSYEAATGGLTIEGLRGTDRHSQILVFRHHGDDFGLEDARIERPVGALLCNAIFGALTFCRQRGPFRLVDGMIDFEAEFARETVVHYDGANGALDAVPADGSLTLDAQAARRLETCGGLTLEVRPTLDRAEVAWRQVRGPRLRLRGSRSSQALVGVDGLGEGEQAAFVVGAAAGRALAVETVFVRPRRS